MGLPRSGSGEDSLSDLQTVSSPCPHMEKGGKEEGREGRRERKRETVRDREEGSLVSLLIKVLGGPPRLVHLSEHVSLAGIISWTHFYTNHCGQCDGLY